MRTGAVAPATPAPCTCEKAIRPRHGRVVKHGPAVVIPDAPRPLLRPSADIDPTSFLP